MLYDSASSLSYVTLTVFSTPSSSVLYVVLVAMLLFHDLSHRLMPMKDGICCVGNTFLFIILFVHSFIPADKPDRDVGRARPQASRAHLSQNFTKASRYRAVFIER